MTELLFVNVKFKGHTMINESLNYKSNPFFDLKRIKATLNLDDGIGALTVELINSRYDDSGVFNLYHSSSLDEVGLNISLDVQGQNTRVNFNRITMLSLFNLSFSSSSSGFCFQLF